MTGSPALVERARDSHPSSTLQPHPHPGPHGTARQGTPGSHPTFFFCYQLPCWPLLCAAPRPKHPLSLDSRTGEGLSPRMAPTCPGSPRRPLPSPQHNPCSFPWGDTWAPLSLGRTLAGLHPQESSEQTLQAPQLCQHGPRACVRSLGEGRTQRLKSLSLTTAGPLHQPLGDRGHQSPSCRSTSRGAVGLLGPP